MADFNQFGTGDDENAEIKKLTVEVVRTIKKKAHPWLCRLCSLFTDAIVCSVGSRYRQLRILGETHSRLRVARRRSKP